MKVLKFGGSSIGTPDRVKGVKKIIEMHSKPCIVVVSAINGVTDQLIGLSKMAAERNEDYKIELEEIKSRYLDMIKFVVKPEMKDTVNKTVHDWLSELEEVLYGVYLLRELSRKTSDNILSFGERLSAFIISNVIENAYYVDTRYLIKTNDAYGKAEVDFALTNILLKKEFEKPENIAIVPGFVGSTSQNETTTLGRGGSDYTAAIIAAALEASAMEIWTDVDGFMTADPKKVDKSYAIEKLTYSEAIELSHFGAKVVYTPTLRPVYKKNIPLIIKNTFNPDAKGTIINNEQDTKSNTLIKGISSIDRVDLITLQGTGMVGVTGTSMRLFGVLAKNEVNIILITQASSEYSITFAINPEDTKLAEKAIEKEFKKEIEFSKELRVNIEKDLSIIAIVGEKMKNTPGISANLFRSLGRNGVNVIATAQGSSELNISVVIKNSSLKKALNVIHEGFFLSEAKELHLFVVGIGLVGKSLLSQIHKQQKKLLEDHKLKVNLVGVSNSKKMLIERKCLKTDTYKESLEQLGAPANLDEFLKQIVKLNLRNSVFVDCTASDDVAKIYNDVLNSYVSIVTANKIACSSEYNLYRELKKTALDKSVRFIFETNVGAGLPIINTINDLIRSGDKIIKLEAVLSGTLNFIFNEISAEVPFSEAVKRAKEKGFSEPDPRIDLSGVDVVRKLLILSRESGYTIEKEDVEVKTFLPAECFEGSQDDFWKMIKTYDADFEKRRSELEKQNKKWRFVAILDQGKAKVELLSVDSSHPSYPLEGSNNIILITTERYNEQPMIIKGYGAGAEVTAAGVFADIIRVANV